LDSIKTGEKRKALVIEVSAGNLIAIAGAVVLR
jgi:hypothetical protein